jgi:organic hydroperoxide reductase OsmC/OhrA
MNSVIATEMTDSDSRHLTTIAWARGEWSHHKGKYSCEHLWHFAGGAKLKASDSMAPDGYRDKVRLSPENLFVATVASAHMLSWLHIAFSMGAEIRSLSTSGFTVFGTKINVSLVQAFCPSGREARQSGLDRARITLPMRQSVASFV